MVYHYRITFKNGSTFAFHSYEIELLKAEGIQRFECLSQIKGETFVLMINLSEVLHMTRGIDRSYEQ